MAKEASIVVVPTADDGWRFLVSWPMGKAPRWSSEYPDATFFTKDRAVTLAGNLRIHGFANSRAYENYGLGNERRIFPTVATESEGV